MRHRSALALVGVLGAGAVGAMAMSAARTPFGYDEAVYLGIARELQATGCPIRPEGPGAVFMNNPPAVTVWVAFLRMLGAVELDALRQWSVVFWGPILVGGVARAAWRGFGPRGAVLAVLALLTFDELVASAGRVELDVPLAAVTALFVAVCLRLGEPGPPSRRSLALAAGLAAMALLIRYQGVFVGPVGAACLTTLARRRGAPWSRALTGAPLACVGGTALGLGIWVLGAYGCGGDLASAVLGNLGRLSGGSQETWFQRPMGEYWVGLGIWTGPLVLVCAPLVIVATRRRILDEPALLLPLALVAVNLVFCSTIQLKAERYFASSLPLLAIVTGGLVCLPALESKRLAPWVMAGAGVAAAMTVVFALLGMPRSDLTRYYERVGRAVAKRVPPAQRILLPHAQVAYFADRHYRISLFEPDPATVMRWLSDPDEEIHAVVLDDRLLTFHPEMSQDDKARLRDFIATHFERIELEEPHATVYLRRD